MTTYVDTNILARLLTNDIPEAAEQAKTWIGRHNPGELIILDAIFVELFFILEANARYRYPRTQSVVFFQTLLRISQFQISQTAQAAFEV